MSRLRIALNRHPEDSEVRPCTACDLLLRAYNANIPGSWRAGDSYRGDCHHVVHRLIWMLDQTEGVSGWTVVQADIPGEQGWHSWLEYDGWVVDLASGTYAISDKRLYYDKKQPQRKRTLTAQEFQKKWTTETGKWWLSNSPN